MISVKMIEMASMDLALPKACNMVDFCLFNLLGMYDVVAFFAKSESEYILKP